MILLKFRNKYCKSCAGAMNLYNTVHCNLSQSWNLDEVTAFAYIREITKVLAEFSWIYSTKNTEIFICDVLENIPSDVS